MAHPLFEDSFVERLTLPASALLTHGERLFQREPVRHLVVVDCDESDIAEIKRTRWLSRLDRLKIDGEIGDVGAQLLADMPALAALRNLNLHSNGIGAEGALALACSPHLRRLQTLTLTNNPIDDSGARALADSVNLDGCERLFLGRCEPSNRGLQALTASAHLGRLTTLGLAGNDEISDAGLAALAKGQLTALRRVELNATSVRAANVDKLAPQLSVRV